MLLSREELDDSTKIHPACKEFLPEDRPESDPYDYLSIRAGMAAMTEARLAKFGPPPQGMTEFHHDIPMRDGYMSNLKVVKPSAESPGPLIVLCYGGGFVAGDNHQFTDIARALCRQFSATVVSISYRLAPEHPFPQSQFDGIDSVKWIAENVTSSLLGSDPTKGFVIGGGSAGGALTAILSRFFQKNKLAHPLTGQWLYIPLIMKKHSCPDKFKSYYISDDQNNPNPTQSKDAMKAVDKFTQADEDAELHFAVNAKTPLSGQPRTYFQIAGLDVLRDDGLVYDEMLKEAGVPTKVDFYPGCFHGHNFMMKGTELANEADVDAIIGIGWLLERDVSRAEAAKALGLST